MPFWYVFLFLQEGVKGITLASLPIIFSLEKYFGITCYTILKNGSFSFRYAHISRAGMQCDKIVDFCKVQITKTIRAF